MKNNFNPSLVMIGENIRKRREALGMSQTELANEVGTDRGTISRYELASKEMGVGKLCNVAVALGCKPGELMPNGEQEQSNNLQINHLVNRLHGLPVEVQDRIVGIFEMTILGAEQLALMCQ